MNWFKQGKREKLVRYCFFDIDGVLNKSSSWRTHPYYLDSDNIGIFIRALKKLNLIPVICSSWRIGFVSPQSEYNTAQIKELENIFTQNNIELKHKTPIYKGKSRNLEINQFLKYHPCDDFVIVDDDPNEYIEITRHNIFTNSSDGFDIYAYKKIMKYF